MYFNSQFCSYKGGQLFQRCGGNAGDRAVMEDKPLLCLFAYALYFTECALDGRLGAEVTVEGMLHP